MLITIRKTEKVYEVSKGVSELFKAAKSNDVAALEEALKHCDDINVTDELGKTPLHYAALASAFDTAARLLEVPGIDRFRQDKFGREAAIILQDVLFIDHPDALRMFDLIWPCNGDDDDLDEPNDDAQADVVPIRPDDIDP